MKNKLRSVNTKFWDDRYIITLTPNEKLLFLYLLTNPLTNLLGIYEISESRIAFDIGLKEGIISNGLERFRKDKKVYYDFGFIIIPNFLKNQNLNANMKVGVVKEFNQLPKDLKDSILSNGLETVSNDYQTILNHIVKYEIEYEYEIEDELESKDEPEEEKIKFADFVFLSEIEYKKLSDRLMKSGADACVEILNNYKASTGKKYKSDYHTILNWVIEKAKKEGKIQNAVDLTKGGFKL